MALRAVGRAPGGDRRGPRTPSGPTSSGCRRCWVEEGGANQAEVLAAGAGLHAAVGEVRFRDGLAFTNAVLSRWPLRTVEHHRLPRADGEPSHRQVVLADVDAPFGRLTFLTTHLDWPFDASADRVAQVRAIAELVAGRRPDPATRLPRRPHRRPQRGPRLRRGAAADRRHRAAGARPGLHRRLGGGRRRRSRPHVGPPQPPPRRRHLAPTAPRLRAGVLAAPQAPRVGPAVLAGGRPARARA